jgi:GT2 family glycosyltransferase
MLEPSVLSLIFGQKIHAKLKKFDFRTKKRIIPFSCAVSFRKDCLEKLKYFDELNFPVLEADLDLSLRIHQSDWKLIYDNSIEIFHTGGNSIPRDYKRVLLFYESRWNLLKKFNKIRFTHLTKILIIFRLLLEWAILKVFTFDTSKVKGREILIKRVFYLNR